MLSDLARLLSLVTWKCNYKNGTVSGKVFVDICSPFGDHKIGGLVRIKGLSEHLNGADMQRMTVCCKMQEVEIGINL
jgi:hypothetical protein